MQRVRYPGFSGLISFDVEDPRAVETATTLIINATSLGGARSTMESRARWEGDRIPAGLLRLSVGLEDVEEIWADLEQALEQRLSPAKVGYRAGEGTRTPGPRFTKRGALPAELLRRGAGHRTAR